MGYLIFLVGVCLVRSLDGLPSLPFGSEYQDDLSPLELAKKVILDPDHLPKGALLASTDFKFERLYLQSSSTSQHSKIHTFKLDLFLYLLNRKGQPEDESCPRLLLPISKIISDHLKNCEEDPGDSPLASKIIEKFAIDSDCKYATKLCRLIAASFSAIAAADSAPLDPQPKPIPFPTPASDLTHEESFFFRSLASLPIIEKYTALKRWRKLFLLHDSFSRHFYLLSALEPSQERILRAWVIVFLSVIGLCSAGCVGIYLKKNYYGKQQEMELISKFELFASRGVLDASEPEGSFDDAFNLPSVDDEDLFDDRNSPALSAAGAPADMAPYQRESLQDAVEASFHVF